MTPKDTLHELLDSLEKTLVKEFLTCQKLEALTKEEQALLTAQEAGSLPALVERKEALLDEMGKLDDARRMFVGEISTMLEIKEEAPGLNSYPGHVRAGDIRKIRTLERRDQDPP